jgi:hypothetical protein
MNLGTLMVDGNEVQILDKLSSGPGCPVHTYQLSNGWLYEIGNQWYFDQKHCAAGRRMDRMNGGFETDPCNPYRLTQG